MGWLHTATLPRIVKRSLKVALLVGTIIALINYGDRLLAGNLQISDLIKILLTYLVPYCVSTHAAVSTLLNQRTMSQQRHGDHG